MHSRLLSSYFQSVREVWQVLSALSGIIGHLKSDFRLSRNFLKGTSGDLINVLMAAAAWNFALWLRAFFVFILGRLVCALTMILLNSGRLLSARSRPPRLITMPG
jgi:IS5 family transposase